MYIKNTFDFVYHDIMIIIDALLISIVYLDHSILFH